MGFEKFEAQFLPLNCPEWRQVEAIAVQSVSEELRSQVGIQCAGKAILRIDLHDYSCTESFSAIFCNAHRVFIGYNDYVLIISPHQKSFKKIELNGYFSAIYSDDEDHELGQDLLIASADRLTRVSALGEIIWKSANIAEDGIVVHRVKNQVIEASCEMAPPGGWQSLQLDFKNGQVLSK